MQLIGTWMTESGSLVYSVVPKCACTTIGQSLYYSDYGTFYDGDIHRLDERMHKWEFEASRPVIAAAVSGHDVYAFSCVRNPYSRILSAFFDKICSIQMGGGRYRETLAARIAQKYGIEYGGADGREPFDQVRSFRRFLLYARDTLMWSQSGWKLPLGPDIHWEPISKHLEGFVMSGGRYDRIVRTERFEEGLQAVFDAVATPVKVDVAKVPRFNDGEGSGPARDHPVEAYFDDLSMHLVHEIYNRDFDLFGYDFENPAERVPRREVDLDYVHAMLSP